MTEIAIDNYAAAIAGAQPAITGEKAGCIIRIANHTTGDICAANLDMADATVGEHPVIVPADTNFAVVHRVPDLDGFECIPFAWRNSNSLVTNT
ncbi:MAG: hypothetical protein U5K38_09455 [Woeseiaceae bacterium]|nr:hypothetical protein [Woeseiaceae bacterium]